MPRGIPGSGPHARKPKVETKTEAPAETVRVEATPIEEMTDEQKAARLNVLLEEVDKLIPQKPADPGIPPGTILERGTLTQHKKIYTKEDMDKFPKKTIIPPFSTPIIFQGRRINVEAGVEIELPEPHFGILMDSIRRNRLNDWMFGRLQPSEEKPPVGGMTRPHLIDVGAAAGLGRGTAVEG